MAKVDILITKLGSHRGFMHKLAHAIQWREDVEIGEMIQRPGYDKTYMSFHGSVSQQEINAICKAINTYYEEMDSNLRIESSMDELIPAKHNG